LRGSCWRPPRRPFGLLTSLLGPMSASPSIRGCFQSCLPALPYAGWARMGVSMWLVPVFFLFSTNRAFLYSTREVRTKEKAPSFFTTGSLMVTEVRLYSPCSAIFLPSWFQSFKFHSSLFPIPLKSARPRAMRKHDMSFLPFLLFCTLAGPCESSSL